MAKMTAVANAKKHLAAEKHALVKNLAHAKKHALAKETAVAKQLAHATIKKK